MDTQQPGTAPRLAVTAVIVVLGAIMTVLDATIVSVAIDTLSRDFGASLPSIQWVLTAYALALAAVIPLTGWAIDRFGGKRVWLVALALFIGGSVLCGLAWSAPSLIAFRVLQGLGGGMVAPVGMTLVAQAAGPSRMGWAMSLIGVPMMLGPVLGPVLGGLIVSAVAWHWIFFINVPVGIVTLLWSWRVLASSPARRTERLDVTGLLLLSPGLVGLVYAVSRLPESGFGSTLTQVTGAAGLALLAGFVVHALRARTPLLDLRQFGNRTFAAAGAIQVLLGATLLGAMLLLPLYYQVVRGRSALETGLLLMPQGAGAALALTITGRLVDRGLGKAVVLIGLPLMVSGFLVYTQATATVGFAFVSAALFVIGLGTGCLMAPPMSMALRHLDRSAIPRATALLNVTQRVGGVLGTAVYAVVLQHNLAGTDAAAAFGATFWWPLGFTAAAVVPALLLRRPAPQPHHEAALQGETA